MPFQNSMLAGQVPVDDLHSEGYVPLTTGWAIDRDGNADFQSISVRYYNGITGKAYLNTPFSFARNAWTNIPLDTQHFNYGPGSFNLTTGQYFPALPGIYRVGFHLRLINWTSGAQYTNGALYYSGDNRQYQEHRGDTNNVSLFADHNGSDLIKVTQADVTAGEYFRIRGYYACTTAGATITVSSNAVVDTELNVELVRSI